MPFPAKSEVLPVQHKIHVLVEADDLSLDRHPRILVEPDFHTSFLPDMGEGIAQDENGGSAKVGPWRTRRAPGRASVGRSNAVCRPSLDSLKMPKYDIDGQCHHLFDFSGRHGEMII